jgi:hypothetical protein
LSAALCRGDLVAITELTLLQKSMAVSLQDAAEARSASATELARELGLPAQDVTLGALAAKLPEPLAGELRAARDRLTALTTELADVQRRNANLIGHLRSYVRGVLATLTAAEAPARYGPSGSQVVPAAGAAIQARG